MIMSMMILIIMTVLKIMMIKMIIMNIMMIYVVMLSDDLWNNHHPISWGCWHRLAPDIYLKNHMKEKHNK